MSSCVKCGAVVPIKSPHVSGPQPIYCSDACRKSFRREYCQAWGKANHDRVAEYRASIRDQVKTWDKEFHVRHRERRCALRRERYRKNKSVELLASRLYRESNRELIRSIGRRSRLNRRARLAEAFIEKVDPMTVYRRDKGICGICSNPIGSSEWHIDHVIPIAKGGRHEYLNVQLAHAQCNRSKGAR